MLLPLVRGTHYNPYNRMTEPNLLYYGDNLDVLREHVGDETVDLVYLDPPFNSNASYNVLFAERGEGSAAQIQAFEDSWHWDDAAAYDYEQTVERGGTVAAALRAFRTLLGTSDMLAYLSMMAPRLVELRRVMNDTASIYLHCDPTASHYLKLLMDSVFGPRSFRTEIIWKRSSAHSDTKQGRRQHGRLHDVLLFYTKSDAWTWNPMYTPYDASYADAFYRHVEPNTGRRYRLSDITGPGGAAKGNPRFEFLGVTRYWRFTREHMDEMYAAGRIVQTTPGTVPAQKRYLDEMPGVSLQDVWTDIDPISAQARERLGYPTQKPEALLERVIQCSSNEGDVVLDPFCGCGTTIAAAQKLDRRWIGIDITHLAIGLIKHRLADAYGASVEGTYRVIGEPTDIEGARQLATDDKFQFQAWALSLVRARIATSARKGADHGIDGRLYFHDEGAGGKTKQIVLSVKGGGTNVRDIRDLVGVMQRESAELGALITLHEPTGPMRAEAASAGFYQSPAIAGTYARVQLLTVEDLLSGAQRLEYPSAQGNVTFRRAPRAKQGRGHQAELGI